MNDVKRLSAIEPVYKEVIPELEKYVLDFCEIDDSAETFRYSKSHDGRVHLENQRCINLRDFAESFSKMSDLFEWLDSINLSLLEYISTCYTDSR